MIQNSSGHVNSSATSARILELEKNLSGARKRLAEAHSQNQEYKQEIDKLKEKVNELDEHVSLITNLLNNQSKHFKIIIMLITFLRQKS